MADVRERWLSRRAVTLHVALLVVVPGCAVAAWWQINRAEDGNQLSYLYSVMWPAFGVLALCFWWMLIHTDYDAAGLKGLRRQQAQQRQDASPAMTAVTAPATEVGPTPSATPGPVEDDPELAAYNARLAKLSAKGAKTWRNREAVVVRRPQ
jgi:hypothetical protein